MQFRKGGAWRSIASAQAYINGAWRPIAFGRAYVNGTWSNVCNFTTPAPAPTPTPTPTPPAMSVGVGPSTIRITGTATSLNTNPITATPSGGRSPYTYNWSILSSDGVHSFTLTSPTTATTQVTCSLGVGETATCSIQCTCSDSTGLTANSVEVDITFENTNFS